MDTLYTKNMPIYTKNTLKTGVFAKKVSDFLVVSFFCCTFAVAFEKSDGGIAQLVRAHD